MGTIIINNYSRINDDRAVRFAASILSGAFSEKFLSDEADALNVDVGVRTDDETGARMFTFTDRD